MMYFIVALAAVSLYEMNRKEIRRISKKLARKYEDWVES